MSAVRQAVVEVDGHELTLSNLDKVLWPKAGFTKADVIDYYSKVAPALLPHLRDRALTLKRYPDGVDGSFFYEKSCPSYAPDWVRKADVFSKTRGKAIRFCVVDDMATLVWAANLADLELHTSLARVDDPLTPTMMVFDLDPGEGTGIIECAKVALRLREMLADLSLESFSKSSGSKGMQVYVPLNTPATYKMTKSLSRAIGELVERESPGDVTTHMKKTEREHRVLIDWSQNDDHKTTVCVYSLRAKDQPTVSTPLTWDEVASTARGDPGVARFLPADVLERVRDHGDLFAPVLEMEQTLPVLVPGG